MLSDKFSEPNLLDKDHDSSAVCSEYYYNDKVYIILPEPEVLAVIWEFVLCLEKAANQPGPFKDVFQISKFHAILSLHISEGRNKTENFQNI